MGLTLIGDNNQGGKAWPQRQDGELGEGPSVTQTEDMRREHPSQSGATAHTRERVRKKGSGFTGARYRGNG